MCLHLSWQRNPSLVTEELPLVSFAVCQNTEQAGASTGFCCLFLLLFCQNSSIYCQNPSGVEGANLRKMLQVF